MNIDMTKPIKYINSSEFHELDADAKILLPAPPRPPWSPGLSTISRISLPPLTRFEQMFYFRKMNYLKFKAEQNRISDNPDTVVIRKLLTEAIEIRNLIVCANVHLFKVRHRHRLSDEMISDLCLTLINTVDRFSYSWQIRFSTFAVTSLWGSLDTARDRIFRRMLKGSAVVRDGKPCDLMSEQIDHRELTPDGHAINRDHSRIITRALKIMRPNWRNALARYYGFDGHHAKYAVDVADEMGISRNRVSQLLQKAEKQLKLYLNTAITAEAK